MEGLYSARVGKYPDEMKELTTKIPHTGDTNSLDRCG